jgi:hypothetical protein
MMLGISSLADQRSTKRVESRRALSPRILADLVRQPLWVTALGANLLADGDPLQILHHGEPATLTAGKPQTWPIPPAPSRPRPSQPPGREPAHRGPLGTRG